MAVLQACGARLGQVSSTNEHLAYRDGMEKPFLAENGADPLGQWPLLTGYEADKTWRERAQAAFADADAVKMVKTAQFWPMMADAFPEARWIVVMRDPSGIAKSCVRAPFMTAFDSPPAWEGWARAYHRHCAALTSTVGACEVWPDRAVRGGAEHFRPMVEYAGLDWNGDAVSRVINPGKWH